MSAQFEFVFADGIAKVSDADRSLIRSRCMRGKNKREGSRRSIRERKRNDAVSNRDPGFRVHMPTPSPPLAHDFALLQFAVPLDIESQEMVFKIYTCNALNHAMSSIEPCVDFECVETGSFHLLFCDAAFLHAVLAMSSAISDFFARRQLTKNTYYHLRQSLLRLNVLLSEEGAFLKDSNMFVVIALAIFAAVSGDWTATGAHIAGLRKIVQLRGGFEYLKNRPKLHFKLDRLDLSWALGSGERPFFLHESISWEPTFKTRSLLYTSSLQLLSLDNSIDDRLVAVFQDFQYLSITININVQNHVKWRAGQFQPILSSIQTRLLRFQDELKDTSAECMRLAMLAVLTTSFKIPGKNVPYTSLANKLRTSYRKVALKHLETQTPDYSSHMLELWALMVSAISVLDFREAWLIARLNSLTSSMGLYTWENLRRCLQRVIWIECIHDEPGEKAYERLIGKA